MAEYRRGSDGGWERRAPGTGWYPVSEAEYEASQRGGFATAAGAFGDTLLDSAAGMMEMNLGGGGAGAFLNPVGYVMDKLGSNEGAELAREVAASNDERQAARWSQYSGPTMAGTVGAFGAEMAVPIGPVGKAANVGNRVARTAGSVKPSNMVRRVTSSVDEVINGSRATAAADEAAEASARFTDELVEAGDGVVGTVDDGVNAARNNAARTTGKGDMLSLQAMEDRGYKLSRAQRAYLEAWESGDEAAVEAAERALDNEDYLRKQSLFGDTSVDDFLGGGVEAMEQHGTRRVLDELGRYDASRVTDEVLAEVHDVEQAVFKRVLDDPARPVSVKVADDAGNQTDIISFARSEIDGIKQKSDKVTSLLKELEDAAQKGVKEGKYGFFANDKLLQVRKKLHDAAKGAWDNGYADEGRALNAVSELIDNAIIAAVDNPNDIARLELARRRWKILRMFDRVGVRQQGDVGKINFRSFANEYIKGTPSLKRHARPRNDFERELRTIEAMTANRANPGSTLLRGAAPMIGTAAKGVAGGAGLLGAGNLLWGN